MSDVAAPSPPTFSPRVMIALVLVGVFAFSGFTVLSVYAPDLKSGEDGQAHALSKSAVGFAGAVVMLKAKGVPVVVSRSSLTHSSDDGPLRVLTPGVEIDPAELKAYDRASPLLLVLPKWDVAPDPLHNGWVKNAGPMFPNLAARPVMPFDKTSILRRRTGVSAPQLHGAGGPFAAGTYLPLDRIEAFQTVTGDQLLPVLVDETGQMVLAQLRGTHVLVLADPDLLNTQGLKGLNNARAGMAIVDVLRGEGGVAFDVSLNGFKRPRSVLRLMFEPPLAGATLCLLVAAVLMGVHAAVRFGPPLAAGRAFALGKRALIDNSADLIRAARKEHELVAAYASLIELRAARAAGGHETGADERTERLLNLERHRKPADSLENLKLAARAARTRGETLSVAAKLFHWKSEMTRDRR